MTETLSEAYLESSACQDPKVTEDSKASKEPKEKSEELEKRVK